MKIHKIKLHKISLVISETELASGSFSNLAVNNFKKIVEDTSLSFDQLLEKLEYTVNNVSCNHRNYPRESSITNIPVSVKEELAKLKLPSIYITLCIQYSDGSRDTDIVVWDDLNGSKKDVIEQMKNKESISLKQKVLAYDKEYEEHYMV